MESSQTCVCVRLRPPNATDSKDVRVKRLSDTEVACLSSETSDVHTFHFDCVLGPERSQLDAYRVTRPIVQGVLNGINGTILTYGQTGSGKTHTLFGKLGDDTQQGIIPRAMQELMDAARQKEELASAFVTVSAAEIYCERLYDLLEPQNIDLQVKEDSVKGVHIAGLVELTVANAWELHQTVRRSMANRTVCSTAMNSQSSRSHCMIAIQFKRMKSHAVPLGKLCMVDLAGSERSAKTGTSGPQMDEGILINKSLSALANVIAALSDGRSRHVPYRDSKLTRVLQDSIGGNSRTMLIVCCSPGCDDLGETLCSLRFGSRARGVASSIRRVPPTSAEQQLIECQQECRELKAELERLKNSNREAGLENTERRQNRKQISNRYPIFRERCVFSFCLHFIGVLLVFALEDIWLLR